MYCQQSLTCALLLYLLFTVWFCVICFYALHLFHCMCCSGNCPPKFLEAMEDEHCSRGGSNFEFRTLNYKCIKSYPRKEWDIVMKRIPCPDQDKNVNRRIPDIKELLNLPLALRAKLQISEVIAVVLYTGPMVRC
jgi:hypothetical protein